MGSPKLRLILLAYLRGFLTPAPAHGIRSQIREIIIGQAMLRELDASGLISRAAMDCSTLSAVAHKERVKVYVEIMTMLAKGRALMEHNSYKSLGALDLRRQQTIEDMGNALNMLKKTNFYDMMAKVLAS